jgi:hypothetical protein
MAEHPITPPPELVEQWTKTARYKKGMAYPEGYEQYEQRLTTLAARWGADQELEACCEWLKGYSYSGMVIELRAARRPKPPSLKEQALEVLSLTQKGWGLAEVDLDTIRRALEALPND